MIYVSSSCVKADRIGESVEILAVNGFNNIELSGGTEYYFGYEHELLKLQEKYDLNYDCHNYFPPPKEHFVLNLASLDDVIFKKSFNHIKESILLSKLFGAKKFGFHAGFFIDMTVNEIGKQISRYDLYRKKESINRFCNAFDDLKENANGIDLYIENNVISRSNYDVYNGVNIFMMTSFEEYLNLRKKIDFNLLLDVAHLKVSSHTCGLILEKEFSNMINYSDYIHISDNDGFHDTNYQLKNDSELLELISKHDVADKDFTLEVYDNISSIHDSYEALMRVI